MSSWSRRRPVEEVFVFDSNSFVVLGHYFPDRFPSFWNKFNTVAKSGEVVSVGEVFNEIYG